MTIAPPVAKCRNCRHFRNDPAYLEAAIKGFHAMSSAVGSVRMDDGLCLRHDRYLAAESVCADFAAEAAAVELC